MSVSGAPGIKNVGDLLILTTVLAISVNMLDMCGARVQGFIRPSGLYYLEVLDEENEL